MYVTIVCVPVSVGLTSEFAMKRAHSSPTLSCEPLGLSAICVELPPYPVNAVVAETVALLLSLAGPLLMKMMKFLAHASPIGLT